MKKLLNLPRIYHTSAIRISCLLILFGLIAAPGQSADRLETVTRLSLVATTALDFSSSFQVPNTAREGNPFLGQSPIRRTVVMTSSSSAVLFFSREKYIKSRWKRIALICGITAAHGWAAAHNWRLE